MLTEFPSTAEKSINHQFKQMVEHSLVVRIPLFIQNACVCSKTTNIKSKCQTQFSRAKNGQSEIKFCHRYSNPISQNSYANLMQLGIWNFLVRSNFLLFFGGWRMVDDVFMMDYDHDDFMNYFWGWIVVGLVIRT